MAGAGQTPLTARRGARREAFYWLRLCPSVPVFRNWGAQS